MCIIDCLSTIVFILPLHLDYTKVIILILWWRNFQLEYWRTFQLVSTSERERDFDPPPLEYQILLTYSITDTVTNDMESCFSADCQETYNQTPVSFTFITPETENLFRPDDYPERFSRWFEKFVEHVTYNL